MPPCASLVRILGRFAACLCLATGLMLAAPAQAATSAFAPIPLSEQVGVAISRDVAIPVQVTLAQLDPLYGSSVLWGNCDITSVIVLNGYGLPCPLTLHDLYVAYPGMTFTVSAISVALTADSRFTLDQGTCAAPSGTSCVVHAAFNGAIPAGLTTGQLVGTVSNLTVSGAGSLGSLLTMIAPLLQSTLSSYLVYDLAITVAKGDQAIAFGAAPTIVASRTGTVSATGGPSGNPVTFSSLSPLVCTVSGTTVSALTGGLCSIAANEAGDANYNAATQVVQSFSIVDPVRLSNISTRMQVLTGNDVLIGGFIIGGASSKTVVVRARGPSLIPFGITNALPNPTLTLVRSSDQAILATNDDWQSAANASAISASGFAPSDALESAILMTLPPGAYTAIVAGAANATGVGIVEVFEVDAYDIPLRNISTRGQVLTGNDVMIGGFIVQGSGPQTVVVRARGPSLLPFGITNALMDPTLTLVRSADQSIVAVNDNWQSAANAAAITSSGFAPSDARESAILITLDPGAYTAIVSGAGGVTGVGIVEVFTMP